MHFIQSSIGEGPFLRADVGWGFFGLVDEDGDEPLGGFEKSGLSTLFGFGYGLPIGSGGSRILFNVNYAMRPGVEISLANESGSVRALSFTVGGLF